MFDTIIVPHGAEARAVRRALARSGTTIAVVETAVGPHAAELAARRILEGRRPARALVTGLCGLLSPAFAVGDALVYREIARDDAHVSLDETASDELAAAVPGALSGIRAIASASVVSSPLEKAALYARTHADAVDMETFALASTLGRVGIAVATLRIGSDAAASALPDLDGALDSTGELDGFALALAMLRRPVAGVRLAIDGSRALAALERAVYAAFAYVRPFQAPPRPSPSAIAESTVISV